jgi:hypothetical protein
MIGWILSAISLAAKICIGSFLLAVSIFIVIIFIALILNKLGVIDI